MDEHEDLRRTGDSVEILAREYAEAQRRDATWLYVQQPRDGAVQFRSFRYVPEYHFRSAYDRLTAAGHADGGYDTLHDARRRTTIFYWLNPETGGALVHTEVNEEETIPFFPAEDEARAYLENRAATGDPEQYDGLSLYEARTRKVADAVDVLTDQAGFDEFVPDGGQQIDRVGQHPVYWRRRELNGTEPP